MGLGMNHVRQTKGLLENNVTGLVPGRHTSKKTPADSSDDGCIMFWS